MESLEQSNQNLSYRLPVNSIPLSYEIIIKSNIHEKDFEFSGNVNIHLKILEATDTITLHCRELEIEKINLKNLIFLMKQTLRFLAAIKTDITARIP